MTPLPSSTTAAALHGVDGGTWTTVEPGRALHWPEPPCAGGEPLDLRRWLAPAHPDLGVLSVPGGIVHGRSGWVWAPDGRLVDDVSWHFDRVAGADAAARLHSHPVERLDGTVLSLLTDWGGENHAHLMYDALPRLDLFERGGRSFDEVTTVLVHEPAISKGWSGELGIPPDRLRVATPDVRFQCDELVAVSFPGTSKALMPWAAEFLRTRLPAAPGARAERLFVPRTTTRLLRNEAAVLEVLARHGYRTIDPESAPHREVRRWFAAAEAVVAPHGAGLADIVHCRPGTPVLELVPTDHPFPYWYAASVASGLRYRHLPCPSTGARADGDAGPSQHDAWCDVELLDAALDAIDAELVG